MINTKLNPQFVTLNYVIWVILTGTGTGTSQTISNTISSKGSNISTTSQFSAASGDEAYPNGQILPTPNFRIFSFALDLIQYLVKEDLGRSLRVGLRIRGNPRVEMGQ